MEQSVDRSAGIAAARAPVAFGPEAGQADLRAPADHFGLALLPVRSARELLIGLSNNWRVWSGAEAAIVALGFIDRGQTLVGHSRDGELPQVAPSTVKPNRQAAGAPAREFWAAAAAFAPDAQPAAVLPFQTISDTIGGVLLYSSHGIGLSDIEREQLCAWSGRLVDQAGFVESRLADRQTLDAEKARALAEFAAGAGHEINNPLATIAGRVQILLRDESDPDRRQMLATIGAQALRVRDMIGDVMLFARPPVPEPRRLLLNELVHSTIERFADTARARSCMLTLRPAGTVFATADRTQLGVVIGELLRNALDAIGSVGEISVGLEKTAVGAKSYAVVSITDNGSGLSEKDRAHLFDPFYAGRDAGRGLGFGLCKCWRIVTNHGGWIEVDSVPRLATTFRTYWPDAA